MASAAVSWSLSDRKCGLFCAGKRRCHGAGAATSSSLFDRDDRSPSALVAPPARRRRQRASGTRGPADRRAPSVSPRGLHWHIHTHTAAGGAASQPMHTLQTYTGSQRASSHTGARTACLHPRSRELSATAQSTRSMTRATCCRRRCRRRWGCGGSSARVREPAEACSAWA